jgi:hypothetical protein
VTADLAAAGGVRHTPGSVAQQAIIALEWQHRQRLGDVFGHQGEASRADRELAAQNWLALPRALATVMARCSVLPAQSLVGAGRTYHQDHVVPGMPCREMPSRPARRLLAASSLTCCRITWRRCCALAVKYLAWWTAS